MSLLGLKLLERLALQRISPTVEGLLSPDQAGFRKGRSTCEQVAALTTFIENGFQQNLELFCSRCQTRVFLIHSLKRRFQLL